MVLEFLVVFTIVIWNQISSSLLVLNNLDYVKTTHNKLSNGRRILSYYENNIALLLLMIYIAVNHSNGLSAMGLSLRQVDIPKIIFVGILATGYLLLSYTGSLFLSKQQREDKEKTQRMSFELLGYSNFTTLWERFTFLGAIWLGVIVEEFVYRGYLILFLGTQTGAFILWVFFSVGLSIAVHLYQGTSWRQAFSHAILASVFVIVVLITKNIITAIIPHMIYNTIWFLRGWIKYSKEDTTQVEPVG